jgi:hypothetical protein
VLSFDLVRDPGVFLSSSQVCVLTGSDALDQAVFTLTHVSSVCLVIRSLSSWLIPSVRPSVQLRVKRKAFRE